MKFPKKTGKQVDHKCRKNYFGSAKGMEAHTASKLFQRSGKMGLNYSTLIGDDDSSTLAKLRAEVNPDIIKISDPTHTNRTLHGKLKAIKGNHKELTEGVIKYIERNFAIAVKQNEGDPDGLAKSLTAIAEHMFGNHDKCQIEWCKYLVNPNTYKHNYLPHGRDLTDLSLKQEVASILATYAKNADKLSKKGSSQPNESLHNTIGSKCPKIRDYSGASAPFRIAAGVAQKNMGYGYVARVMEKLHLSPGKHTQKHGNAMERIRRKRISHLKTPAAKRRRMTLKIERAQKQADSETREGSSYQSAIALENVDYEQIPDAVPKPVLICLRKMKLQMAI